MKEYIGLIIISIVTPTNRDPYEVSYNVKGETTSQMISKALIELDKYYKTVVIHNVTVKNLMNLNKAL